ncbi:hypothetical protein CPI83_30015 (plasmid) [Rhodococcus sp. H-CA8f]|uniref:hypothetical protein n=1 Tax=Rhodococcus sp. H-CA8f TaxID=1727214 RepID=UPI000BE2C832|nr:hypothetical protein [Rhodococcus sp. H-CA8f]ATI36436.1 hypothetical protein CPI83_30015 [Rhodococcus sp. H-CA8f]
MSTHTKEPAIHPVQMSGKPRRLYLIGSLLSTAGFLLLPMSVGYAIRQDANSAVLYALFIVAVAAQVLATRVVQSAYWHVPTKDLERLPRWPSVVKRTVVTISIALVAAVSMAYGNGTMHLAWVFVGAGIVGIEVTLMLGSLLDRFFGTRDELERRDITWMVGEAVSAAVIGLVVWLQFDAGLVESVDGFDRVSDAVEVCIVFGLSAGIGIVGFPLVALRWWKVLSARSKV